MDSYGKYSEKVLFQPDKYVSLRIHIKELFTENKNIYGYRRIHALLKHEGIIVSENIVRKIIQEENLVVKIKRDFSSKKPNSKWLTDITEFAILAGKVYLSPIMDCFDGLLVTWKIELSPDSSLVNIILDDTVRQLSPDEKPIVYSDRGVTGWIERMNKSGLTRSMSKKGCSPDNAACEGVFGKLKNERFYNTDWQV